MVETSSEEVDGGQSDNRKKGRKFWFIFPDWQFRVIDKKFQFTIYAYFIGLCWLTLGIVAYFTKYISGFIFSADFFYMLISIFTAFLLFAAVLSHKLVGPIYNIKKHMASVRKENNTLPVVLREDDFFTELAEEYNQLLNYMTDKS